jgi:hypothetical protein
LRIKINLEELELKLNQSEDDDADEANWTLKSKLNLGRSNEKKADSKNLKGEGQG